MKVKDVMTTSVATVGPEATLKQVAELMAERGISGLPVVAADGTVLGVVSEADIVVKAASHPEKAGVFWRLFAPEGLDERRLRATDAEEAMTSPALTVDADVSVAEAARLMVEHGVKRLPVLVKGELVGIVSRADIVRAFTRPDSEIWEEIRNNILPRQLWIPPETLEVSVNGGRVAISGQVETRTDAGLVEAFAWRVPGVVAVDCSALNWEIDDRARRAAGIR
jgi:CBS domain-containing protein